MEKLIKLLRQEVIKASHRRGFVHRQWYYRHHIKVVVTIALWLAGRYSRVNRHLVEIMAMLHDYGKFFDAEHQHDATLKLGRELMERLKFPTNVIEKPWRALP